MACELHNPAIAHLRAQLEKAKAALLEIKDKTESRAVFTREALNLIADETLKDLTQKGPSDE
jgi:hypothetical protein